MINMITVDLATVYISHNITLGSKMQKDTVKGK